MSSSEENYWSSVSIEVVAARNLGMQREFTPKVYVVLRCGEVACRTQIQTSRDPQWHQRFCWTGVQKTEEVQVRVWNSSAATDQDECFGECEIAVGSFGDQPASGWYDLALPGEARTDRQPQILLRTAYSAGAAMSDGRSPFVADASLSAQPDGTAEQMLERFTAAADRIATLESQLGNMDAELRSRRRHFSYRSNMFYSSISKLECFCRT